MKTFKKIQLKKKNKELHDICTLDSLRIMVLVLLHLMTFKERGWLEWKLSAEFSIQRFASTPESSIPLIDC